MVFTNPTVPPTKDIPMVTQMFSMSLLLYQVCPYSIILDKACWKTMYTYVYATGVGIFCMGAGLSVYHGITGLVSPGSLESIWIAMGILGKYINK